MNDPKRTDAVTQSQSEQTTRFAAAFLTLFLATFFLGKKNPQLGIGQIVLLWGLLVPDLRRVVVFLFLIYYFLLAE